MPSKEEVKLASAAVAVLGLLVWDPLRLLLISLDDLLTVRVYHLCARLDQEGLLSPYSRLLREVQTGITLSSLSVN